MMPHHAFHSGSAGQLERAPALRFPSSKSHRFVFWASIAIAGVLVLSCKPVVKSTTPFLRLVVFLGLAGVLSSAVSSQQNDLSKPIVVQPGAPGKPSKTLPPSTKAALPPLSQADVEFMQGMIMHHAQAVEMTALIDSHSENKDLRSLGARISHSQSDEIRFMQRWLTVRGEPVSMSPQKMSGTNTDQHMNMSHESMHLMPGMLTTEQMEALRKARGADFDRLFLTGMIQHHNGALTMVKDLFDTAGAGQEAELFNFATDVDTGQRAEIRIMREMLERNAPAQMKEEKR
jgi:uncharacterized protein (DUF305 family)